MKKIPLSKGLVTVVDDEDFEWLSQYKWFAAAASGCEDLHYAVRNVPAPETKHGHRLLRMHIAIMGASGIDHRDGDGLNNQKSNLRRATPGQNAANKRTPSTNTSGLKGVWWSNPLASG